jgi:hypothetical protein
MMAVALAAGCGPGRTPYPEALQSQRPEERTLAVKHAAEAHDRSAIPTLVDRLEDEDEAVRFYAILALEKLTGTRLGYDYSSPETQRRQAVERWRRYVQASGTTTAPAAAPLTGPNGRSLNRGGGVAGNEMRVNPQPGGSEHAERRQAGKTPAPRERCYES